MIIIEKELFQQRLALEFTVDTVTGAASFTDARTNWGERAAAARRAILNNGQLLGRLEEEASHGQH